MEKPYLQQGGEGEEGSQVVRCLLPLQQTQTSPCWVSLSLKLRSQYFFLRKITAEFFPKLKKNKQKRKKITFVGTLFELLIIGSLLNKVKNCYGHLSIGQRVSLWVHSFTCLCIQQPKKKKKIQIQAWLCISLRKRKEKVPLLLSCSCCRKGGRQPESEKLY